MVPGSYRARLLWSLAPIFVAALAHAAPDPQIAALARQEKEPLLATLMDFVAIESGSGDREGLDRLSTLIGERFGALGAKVEYVEPASDAYRMHDTPKSIGRMVKATFTGTGTKKILLIAHMDTVYLRGMGAQQPFRIEKDRAYGLGIADCKQGIATILHTMAMLKAMSFSDYGVVTVLINGDEEISSPGSRSLLTKLGGEHDAVMSFEATRLNSDQLSLATAGIAAINLKVKGKASHAGSAPEQGRNALYELAHQILQARDLSDPATGVKMNWTMARAGTNRNVIPANAEASADVRVLRIADYDGIEAKARERGIDQRLAIGLDPDVAADRDRLGAGSAAFVGNLLLNVEPPCRQYELRFLRRKPARDLGADALRSAGDHDDLVGECHRCSQRILPCAISTISRTER